MLGLNDAMIRDKNFGIGVDIENICRFRKLDMLDDDIFLNRVFTKSELDYCFSKDNPAQHLAARYAGKEAVIKALTSIGKIKLDCNSVEICHNGNKAPIARINDKNYQNLQVNISLSHCKDKSIAFAAVIEDDKHE